MNFQDLWGLAAVDKIWDENDPNSRNQRIEGEIDLYDGNNTTELSIIAKAQSESKIDVYVGGENQETPPIDISVTIFYDQDGNELSVNDKLPDTTEGNGSSARSTSPGHIGADEVVSEYLGIGVGISLPTGVEVYDVTKIEVTVTTTIDTTGSVTLENKR